MDWRKLTVRDIEAFYQGIPQHPFISLSDALVLQKALGEVSTMYQPEYLNVIYGMQAWAQFNTKAVTFGALPKTTWPRTGWRVIRSLDASETDIAVAETGTLPQSTRPEIATVRALPKILAKTFEVTEPLESLASIDDVWGSVDQVRSWNATEFAILIDKQLVRRAIGVSGDTSEDPTVTPYVNMMEPIDRIVSSSEEANIGSDLATPDPVGGTKTAYYGIDRTQPGNEWANAQVVHNNGSLQPFSADLMTKLLNLTRQKGAQPTMWLTGPKTYAALQTYFLTFVRYLPMSETKVKFGIDGVQPGIDGGVEVAAVYGIPVIVDPYMPLEVDASGNEVSNSLNRIYLLDTSDPDGYGVPRASISVLRPVEYFESRDFVLLNKFVIKGLYRFLGQTTFRYVAGQGKIRDLSE